MVNFASNTTPSLPRRATITNYVDVGGFAFDVRAGLVLPAETSDDDMIVAPGHDEATA